MSETIHRRDINPGDFRILAKFCGAMNKLSQDNAELLYYLGEVLMFLPVWYKSAGDWRLSKYKGFKNEAIGIATADFRRICRYMDMKEPVVINTLFRMSIVAVAGWQSTLDKPRFRQDFAGVPYSMLEGDVVCYEGFVLEMRRCEGAFRGFRDDPFWYSEDIHSHYEKFSADEC